MESDIDYAEECSGLESLGRDKVINLKSLIASGFYSVHEDIKSGRHTHYWIKGGRGSTKSSFISIEIILGIMRDKRANAVILRKVGETLKDSVYGQLDWAIEVLGVSSKWQRKLSPLEMIYLPTGQRIVFRGADKPRKIKSTKFKNGFCRFIWYEEVDEFSGSEDLRIINQSLMRGGDDFCVFYSYNPPKSQNNWVNREILIGREDRLIHHSTYLQVPKSWLGNQFFIEAEHLKNTKPREYSHEYLGEVTGTGGQVFSNVLIREISDLEISLFEGLNRGLDWGYASDPLHYTVNYYDEKRKRLYIFFEIQKSGLGNFQAAQLILEENAENGIVICDSAEPKSINEICGLGIRAIGAKKGPDSISYGIKWLQELEAIIIDPIRCPKTAEEFFAYELESDGLGGFVAKFPDRNNHSIDATRYSLIFLRRQNEKKKEMAFNFLSEKNIQNGLKGSRLII